MTGIAFARGLSFFRIVALLIELCETSEPELAFVEF
jgi:hypothetical protein